MLIARDIDIKEHVAITIFSTTAAESALAIGIFAADELYYNLKVRLIVVSLNNVCPDYISW